MIGNIPAYKDDLTVAADSIEQQREKYNDR